MSLSVSLRVSFVSVALVDTQTPPHLKSSSHFVEQLEALQLVNMSQEDDTSSAIEFTEYP